MDITVHWGTVPVNRDIFALILRLCPFLADHRPVVRRGGFETRPYMRYRLVVMRQGQGPYESGCPYDIGSKAFYRDAMRFSYPNEIRLNPSAKAMPTFLPVLTRPWRNHSPACSWSTCDVWAFNASTAVSM